ncbi:MAG: BatD family protein, partial [Spirochaetaceae bacterium]|nr:BatD family protein [Spirochaetaceae bacterium]
MLVKNNIIFAYIFLALSFQAGAEEEKKDLKILLEFAPDAIIQNEPFTLNILVNHPDPDEIYMEPPDFHGAFTMERMRVETRFVLSSPREGDRWTDFEFLLTAIETGSQRLDPFQITVFEETVKTNPVNVYVREEKLDTKIALAWFGEGGRGRVYPVRIGDSREVALRITNWRESSVYPAIPLRIEAPQNAIIEGAALSKNDRDAGIILRLKIIPLDEKPIIINRQSVYYEKNPLEIPALQVNVLPAAVKGEKGEEKKAGETSYGETAFIQTTFTAQKTEEASANPYVSFSTLINNNKNIFILLREGIDDCVNEAALLWSQGQYAAALAALRRGERVLTAGYAVRTARIICENMLKLPPSPREPWLPHRPLLFIFTFSAAVFIF